ncbi:MAG TPA: hypothetical protein VF169_05560 [Albitalea sp.]|uniref:carboxymuconolactone decarboxylase family protein n=1 Tax=Piscinibacter sp. TaxID=1903157 RepID=UPI002ED5F23B
MFISAPPDSEATARVYQSSFDSQGFIMNLTRIWAWRPDVFDGFAALRAQLMGSSSLSKREFAVLVCAMAAALGDSYCALAWGKTLAGASDPPSAAAVLQGVNAADLSAREQALSAWARKVVTQPNETTAADVARLRDAGLGDKEIAEATLFVAFRLAFSTVNDALGAQPDWQLAASAPAEVVAAVRFGRPSAAQAA